MLLQLLPNGDWRRRSGPLQLYVGQASVDATVAETVAENGLVTALAGTMLEGLNEARWHGAAIAIDRDGLLEACCGLGSQNYDCYMRTYHGYTGPGPVLSAEASGLDQAHMPLEDK